MESDLTFDWDPANTRHVGRHGVTQIEVGEVFANEAVDIDYQVIEGEARWTSVGHTAAMRILVVCGPCEQTRSGQSRRLSQGSDWHRII